MFGMLYQDSDHHPKVVSAGPNLTPRADPISTPLDD